jgi:hypothetical protein
MRSIDDVRVDVQRRRDARMPELLLGDLDWHLQVWLPQSRSGGDPTVVKG